MLRKRIQIQTFSTCCGLIEKTANTVMANQLL